MGNSAMAENILVTGGWGFLGQAIICELLKLGHRIHTLNRGAYPELAALGVRCFRGDLADLSAVRAAAESCTVIFHVGAKAGVWGTYADYFASNVLGTRHILQVCREQGIRRLIYTSSPSVTFDGKDQEGVDETTPYPQHFEAFYPATKAIAEREVLAANGPELATVALRPHLIWGPGDNHIIPRLIERARRGRLRLIGSGEKPVDAVYIDNAAAAHLCALHRLSIGSRVAGKAYYITNDEPWPAKAVINGFLQAAGLPEASRHISLRWALRLATCLEKIYRFTGITAEPPLTRFMVKQLGTAHWYNTRAAREDLGYRPQISMQQGMESLRQSFSQSPKTQA